MSERGDTAYSLRVPRGGAFGRRRRTPPRRGSANSDNTGAKIPMRTECGNYGIIHDSMKEREGWQN